MHATVCLLRAGQPRRAGATAKSGQFVGQFSWVTGDPIGLKGLTISIIIKLTFDNYGYLFQILTWLIYMTPQIHVTKNLSRFLSDVNEVVLFNCTRLRNCSE